MDTLYRQWLMLRMVPRRGKITASEIRSRLENEYNTKTTLRTIQRDLVGLSDIFPLVADDHKPCGWSWQKDAPLFDLPGMDLHSAVTLSLAKAYLKPLLPRTLLRSLKPHFKSASDYLQKMEGTSLGQWPAKVRVIPAGQPLMPPEVPEDVLDTVYGALLNSRRIRVVYRKRASDSGHEYELNPLALVCKEQFIYLICTINNHSNPANLPLHRMNSPLLLDKLSECPTGFDLDSYLASGELQFPEDSATLKLQALFDRYAGAHLSETPLSKDQKVTVQNDGRMLVKATVQDTEQLRWWLLSFGENVEVLYPKWLRKELAGRIHVMGSLYRDHFHGT